MTLVELCVSAAALTTLLAAVVPAARNAREASASAGCQQNLGRIGQAALIYAASDPSDLMIPINPADASSQSTYMSPYAYGGRSGWGSQAPGGGDADFSEFSGSYGMGAKDRPLNRILYKNLLPSLPNVGAPSGGEDWSFDTRLDLGVYHCRADAGFPGMHQKSWKDSGLSSYDYYGTSYAASALLAGPQGSGQALFSPSVYMHPVSLVPVPASTIAYQENAARFAMFATNPELDQSGCFWPYGIGSQVAHGWHGGDFNFNVSFVDGSVRSTKMRGYGRSPGALCPTNTQNCDCALLRGPTWRMDVAPAPYIPANKIHGPNIGFIWEIGNNIVQ